jgi:hypothetical protein
MPSKTAPKLLAAIATASVVAMSGGTALANSSTTAYAMRTAHHVSKNWVVKVLSSDHNADSEVADANEFNDTPNAGYQYVSVAFRTTKISKGEGNPFWDLEYRLYGHATHRLYESAMGAYLTNAIEDADSVLKGGRTTSTIVFEVKKSDIRAGAMRLVVQDENVFTGAQSWFKA